MKIEVRIWGERDSLGPRLWHWRKVSRNGQVKATSGEGFATKSNAMRAAKSEADAMKVRPPIVVVEE